MYVRLIRVGFCAFRGAHAAKIRSLNGGNSTFARMRGFRVENRASVSLVDSFWFASISRLIGHRFGFW